MFESLGFLSDQQVRDGGLAAVTNERESTLVVLNFLIEIEKRRLYLEDGYSSMFDFCTAAWGYSRSAAWRRIQTARCIVRFPRILEMLERNEVNPSTVAQASRILNEGNCDVVLARICGKSQREVESIVPEYLEESPPRERARTVVVRVPTTAVTTLPSFNQSAPESAAVMTLAPTVPPYLAPIAEGVCEKSPHSRNGTKTPAADVPQEVPSNIVVPADSNSEIPSNAVVPADSNSEIPADNVPGEIALPARVVLQKRVALALSVPVEFMTKIERLRAVTWHGIPAGASFTHILSLALDIALSVKDPAARHARRSKRNPEARKKGAHKNDRYISPSVRDEVCRRDDSRCTYVGKDGHRCTATAGLQVDHIRPIARGGVSTIDNLRLLCAQHNRHEAERMLGPRGR